MSAFSYAILMPHPNTPEKLPDAAAPAPSLAEPMTLWQWLTAAEPKRFMLPLTGVWILGLDWVIFTKNVLLTAGFATPLAAATGFVLGGVGTYLIQRRIAKETAGVAGAKALLAGLAVGIPFPLAGSAIGSWILIASGLHSIKDRILKKQ